MKISVEIEVISNLTKSVLRKYGLPDNECDIVVSHLLEEELLGKASHGFYRLPSIVSTLKANSSSCEVCPEKETRLSAIINGNNHLGLVVAQKACEYALAKSKTSGISIVGVSNYVGTTGAMGYYTRQLANQNLIGICLCTSEYAVAPWGGKDPILGTNPISISIPTKTSPIVIDFSTSARTYGELMLAVKEKLKVPEGIVLDEHGNPSTNPDDANNGCQLPMAEHKGYGLGLAIEILAGIFVGSKAGKTAVLGSDGMLFITFVPDLFVTMDQFFQNVDILINEIKSSGLACGSSGIRIPGQDSLIVYEKNRTDGRVNLNKAVFQEIDNLNKQNL